MTYKIAVVGLGKIATDQHMPCITKNKKFKLVATVSRNASPPDLPHFKIAGRVDRQQGQGGLCSPVHATISAACNGARGPGCGL